MPTRWRQLWDLERSRPIVSRLEIADTVWKRAIGLLGRTHLEARTGLWLEPCSGIHTLGLLFSIDVLFLDSDGRIMRLVPNLRPWRICGPVRGARTVVELPAGALTTLDLQIGRRLMVTSLGSPDFPS
jgi:uncharacterized membrane protein (UPF0127 family)